MAAIKIGIVGATGYTGSELVYLLQNHSHPSLEIITSESRAGQSFSSVHPQFVEIADQSLQPMSALKETEVDVVFLGLPHGVSMDFVKEYEEQDFIIIDLSGDFRLKSAQSYNQWYPEKHVYPQGFEKAVFGLPELFRSEIRQADLIANPGCYPTSVILPLAPLLAKELIQPAGIVADAKSGVTGAGAKAKQKTHFPNLNDNFSAYGLKQHRHTPEMQQALERHTGQLPSLLFTPHLLPVNRGILSTIYAKPQAGVGEAQLQEALHEYYEDERFVRVVEDPPALQDVRGSNYCNVFVTYDDRTQKVLAVSCIDNLVKGAAGQALQNMNIVFDLPEQEGLTVPPLQP